MSKATEIPDLYEDAVKLAAAKKHISAHILQVAFHIGYSRAIAIIDRMKEQGLVDRDLKFVGKSPSGKLF